MGFEGTGLDRIRFSSKGSGKDKICSSNFDESKVFVECLTLMCRNVLGTKLDKMVILSTLFSLMKFLIWGQRSSIPPLVEMSSVSFRASDGRL